MELVDKQTNRRTQLSTPSAPRLADGGVDVAVTLKMHDLKIPDKENYGSGKCKSGK